MFSAHTSAEARPIVRCQACTLNQFLPSTGTCRRCRRSLGNYHLVIPISTEPATLESATRSFRQSVGAFVRAIRIERGLTQKQLAICLRTHRTVISRMECGHKFPPLAMLAHAGFLMGLDKAIVILRARELEKGSLEGRSFIQKLSMDRNSPNSSERSRQPSAGVNVF